MTFKFGVDSFIWTEVFSVNDLWIIPKAKELVFTQVSSDSMDAVFLT